MMLPIVKQAVDAVGSAKDLAQRIGAKRPALYAWIEVPAEYVLPIERATQGRITRHDMRPDLYPREGKTNGQKVKR